jgi:hypothetical protein
VIEEGHYVEYLYGDVWHALPTVLVEPMRNSRWLFFGYAMRDWNLLIVLHRLGVDLARGKSFAVQLRPSEIDILRWRKRGVELLDIDLSSFVELVDVAVAEQLNAV